jgi:hypothetical protein
MLTRPLTALWLLITITFSRGLGSDIENETQINKGAHAVPFCPNGDFEDDSSAYLVKALYKFDQIVDAHLASFPALLANATAAVRREATLDLIKLETMGHTAYFGLMGDIIGEWLENNRTLANVQLVTLYEYGMAAGYGIADAIIHLVESPEARRRKWVL